MIEFVRSTALKDLRIRLRDPLALLLWIGIPLVIGTLLTLATGGSSGPKPRAKLYVDDRDETLVSEALAQAFEQGPLERLFEVEPLDEAAARERLNDDEGTALLVIEQGFMDALLRDRPTKLSLVTNPAQRILPGIVRESLELLPDAVFYVHRLLGAELRELVDSTGWLDGEAPDDAQIFEVGMAVRRSIERIEKYVFPPVIELAVEQSKQDDGGFDFGRAFYPSMLFMALFFMAQGLSDELWKERTEGTLRRLAAAPRSMDEYLAGKLVAAVCLIAPVTLIAYLFCVQVFDLPWSRAPLAVLWGSAAGLFFFAMFALIQMLASSQRGGQVLSNVVLFPLLMIGGCFFPFEAMPDWMADIGRKTPNGWALSRFRDLIEGELELAPVALAFAVLLVGVCALTWLCARRLKLGFAAS